MGEATKIEWADKTWSPWIGCTKIAPACDGCYAAHLMDTRLGRVEWGPHGERLRTSASYWRQPLRWDREAKASGRSATVFPSLCDPFDNRADPYVRREWFGLIRETPHLLWLLLTKRPGNIVRMVKEVGFMPANIAFGATCEDRARVKQNLPHLMVAAGLRPRFLFLSAEPLLEDLGDLSPWLSGDPDTQNGDRFERGIKIGSDGRPILPALGWVITGGETDRGSHKARITHPDLFRAVRDQCAAFETPYLHKQNGEYRAVGPIHGDVRSSALFGADERCSVIVCRDGAVWPDEAGQPPDDACMVERVGKKAAGRLLDGVEHNAMPAARQFEGAPS